MDKKCLSLLAVLVFLATVNITKAETMLVLNYAIYKNDSVDVYSLNLADSTVLIPQTHIDEYQIELLDKTGRTHYIINTPVIFYVFDLGEVNKSSVYLRIPWSPDMRYINFLHYKKTIYRLDLYEHLCKQCNSYKLELSELCDKCQPSLPLHLILGVVILLVVLMLYLYKKREDGWGCHHNL